MFSDTTLNRIYDRGSSVYNYSLGGEGFTYFGSQTYPYKVNF